MGNSASGIKLMQDSKIEVINSNLLNINKLPLKEESIDIVTIFDVIEHFPKHPLQLLNETRRILKSGGRLLLSGPNCLSILKKIYMLTGRHPYINYETWISNRYYSHYREYTKDEYVNLVELAGLKVEKVILSTEPWKTRMLNKYNHRKLNPISFRYLGVVGCWLIQTIFPTLRESIYVVAKKI